MVGLSSLAGVAASGRLNCYPCLPGAVVRLPEPTQDQNPLGAASGTRESQPARDLARTGQAAQRAGDRHSPRPYPQPYPQPYRRPPYPSPPPHHHPQQENQPKPRSITATTRGSSHSPSGGREHPQNTARAAGFSHTRQKPPASGLAPCSHLSVPRTPLPGERWNSAKGRPAALAGNRTRVNCLEGSYAHHYTTNAPQPGRPPDAGPGLAPAYSRRRLRIPAPTPRQPEALRRAAGAPSSHAAPQARQRHAVAGNPPAPPPQGGAPAALRPSGPSLPAAARQRLPALTPGGQRGARSFQHPAGQSPTPPGAGRGHFPRRQGDTGPTCLHAAGPSRAHEPTQAATGGRRVGGRPAARQIRLWSGKAVGSPRRPSLRRGDRAPADDKGLRLERCTGRGGRRELGRAPPSAAPWRLAQRRREETKGGDTHHYTNEDGGDRPAARPPSGSRAACPRLPLPSTGRRPPRVPTQPRTKPTASVTAAARHPDRDPDPRGAGPSPARRLLPPTRAFRREKGAREGKRGCDDTVGARRPASGQERRGWGGPARPGPSGSAARAAAEPGASAGRRAPAPSTPTPDARPPACLPACLPGVAPRAARQGRRCSRRVGSQPGERPRAQPGPPSGWPSGLRRCVQPRRAPPPAAPKHAAPRRVASPPPFAGAPTSARGTAYSPSQPCFHGRPRQLSRQAGTPSSAPAPPARLRSPATARRPSPRLARQGAAACPRPLSAVRSWPGRNLPAARPGRVPSSLPAGQRTPAFLARVRPGKGAPLGRERKPCVPVQPTPRRPARAPDLGATAPVPVGSRCPGRSQARPGALPASQPAVPEPGAALPKGPCSPPPPRQSRTPGARSARAQEPGSHAFGSLGLSAVLRMGWGVGGRWRRRSEASPSRARASRTDRAWRPFPRPLSHAPPRHGRKASPPEGLWVGTRRSLRGTMARGRSDHAAPAPDRDPGAGQTASAPGALTRQRQGRGGRGRRRRRGTGRVGPRPVAPGSLRERRAPGSCTCSDPVLQVARPSSPAATGQRDAHGRAVSSGGRVAASA
nr:basic proline-rich protein-like [Ovis aries]